MFDKTKVREQIENLTEVEKIAIWNEYCEKISSFDDTILENDLDEILAGETPSEVASVACTDAYNLYDDYCCFDGYGKLKSFSNINEYNSPFDMDSLIDCVVDNENTLGYFSEYDVEVEEDEDEEDGDE
jgi:hypothetical protein